MKFIIGKKKKKHAVISKTIPKENTASARLLHFKAGAFGKIHATKKNNNK